MAEEWPGYFIEFQFLIGSLEAVYESLGDMYNDVFQFLIGSLEASGKNITPPVARGEVSIPHR